VGLVGAAGLDDGLLLFGADHSVFSPFKKFFHTPCRNTGTGAGENTPGSGALSPGSVKGLCAL
ncbi:MAG: hypothetical protein IKZ19_08535, partial [Clostridia bacterium]|nr:hypothetical protein [Clostridia bacterium]